MRFLLTLFLSSSFALTSVIATAIEARAESKSKSDNKSASTEKETAKALVNTPPDGYELARTRKLAEAREWSIKRLVAKPNDGDLLHLKAWMEILLNKPKDALQTTAKSLALKSHVGYSHKLRAEAYYILDDGLGSLFEINEALRLMPHEQSCYQIRSRVNAGLGRIREADRDHKIRTILSQLYCAWDKVVEDNPEDLRPNPNRKTTFEQEYAAGQKAFARLSFKSAADYFSRVIELRPEVSDAYLYRAQALESQDKWDKALTDLTHLISQGENKMLTLRVAPENLRKVPFEQWSKAEIHMAEAYKRRARCYASMQKHDLAIQDLNIAVKQQPEDRWTIESRGNAYTGFKKFRKAIDDYIAAEHLEPTYTNTTSKIIECCMNAGEYKLAIIRISWHLKNAPVDDVMILERANAFSHLGFHKEAIEDLTFVMSVTPDYKKAYLRRAKEYEIIGKLNKALEDYTKATSLDRNSKEALEGRDRVMQKLNAQPKVPPSAPRTSPPPAQPSS